MSGGAAALRQETPATSRDVPDAVRERVLERAGYCCEYHAPDGTRCSSRTGLQIEHSKPFAIFRTHDEKPLRLRAFALRSGAGLGATSLWPVPAPATVGPP